MKFEVTPEQQKKLDEWLKDVYSRAVNKQIEETKEPNEFHRFCWDNGVPYTGTIGGGLSYIFSPTSIGLCLTVKESLTGEEIDLTEYDLW